MAVLKLQKEEGENHEGFTCNNCTGCIKGFRYTCVQCSDYDLCSACEAKGAHDMHYVLRIPKPAPYEEIQSVLNKIRLQLHYGGGFTGAVRPTDTQIEVPIETDTQADTQDETLEDMEEEVKVEIKEEPDDLVEMDPLNTEDALDTANNRTETISQKTKMLTPQAPTQQMQILNVSAGTTTDMIHGNTLLIIENPASGPATTGVASMLQQLPGISTSSVASSGIRHQLPVVSGPGGRLGMLQQFPNIQGNVASTGMIRQLPGFTATGNVANSGMLHQILQQMPGVSGNVASSGMIRQLPGTGNVASSGMIHQLPATGSVASSGMVQLQTTGNAKRKPDDPTNQPIDTEKRIKLEPQEQELQNIAGSNMYFISGSIPFQQLEMGGQIAGNVLQGSTQAVGASTMPGGMLLNVLTSPQQNVQDSSFQVFSHATKKEETKTKPQQSDKASTSQKTYSRKK